MFKWIATAVNDVGNGIGDAAGFVAKTAVQVVTLPARGVGEIIGEPSVGRALDDAAKVVSTVSTAVIQTSLQTVTMPARTVLNTTDKLIQGDVGGALKAVKSGVVSLLPFIPVVRAYRCGLQDQAKGHWQKLPEALVEILAPHYNIDLRSVEYAVVNTLHGQATTFEHQIFFPKSIDLNNKDDLWWMLHELEHTVQYKNKGGFENFLLEYFADGAAKIIQTGNFDVHDNMRLEKEADAKAYGIVDQVYRMSVGRQALRPM